MRYVLITKIIIAMLVVFSSQQGYASDEAVIIEFIEQAQPSQQDIAEAKKKIEQKKDVKLLADLTLIPFHKRREIQIKPTDKVYCNGCHLPLPHSKSLRTRAFMNMHTSYIACETCHLKRDAVQFEYKWYDYKMDAEAEKLSGRLHSGRLKDDKTPLLEKDGMVKIAPFYQNQPALINRDNAFSKSLQQSWEKAGLNEKANIQAKIHTPLETKGTECATCHTTEQGILDLNAMSDTPEQAKAIQKNTIADFFKHYKPEKPLAPGALPEPEQRIKITDLLN